MIEFQAWPKTPRLFRDIVVTEKIDGTNAAVIVSECAAYVDTVAPGASENVEIDGRRFHVGAQSRKRLVTPGDDNFGFAGWVAENALDLARLLGPGYHFGEWWGSGIQRGYGLAKGEKRFSLFNVSRYADADLSEVPGLGVVPVLYTGPNETGEIRRTLHELAAQGSQVAPGFARPEGVVVVFHSAARQVFKVLIENDETPKGNHA